ncbi:MAG: heme exporter protein CcmD [Rhodocyclaceae bacterium]|nr:heme exporter protein CcmD [Rhodocyclaceae bacterium]
MQWESWSAFWDMGGAAFFVWGSYLVTALLMAVELVLVLRRRKDTVRRLIRLRRAAPPGKGGPVIEESVQ